MSAKNSDGRAPFRMTPLVFHVLLSMADGPAHAYGMMKEIGHRTEGYIDIGPGSMHFTLNKLSEAGMIEEAGAEQAADTGGPARRYYRLTDYGRSTLLTELDALEEIVRLAREKRMAMET